MSVPLLDQFVPHLERLPFKQLAQSDVLVNGFQILQLLHAIALFFVEVSFYLGQLGVHALEVRDNSLYLLFFGFYLVF